MKRLNKTYKLAFALAMSSTAPIIGYSLFDATSKTHAILEARVLSCEQFSLVCTLCLQRDDPSILRGLAKDLIERDPSLAGIKINRLDGFKVCDLGDFSSFESSSTESDKDDRRIRANLRRLQQPWGTVDFFYKTSANQESSNQVFSVTLLAILFNLGIFSLILRRSLSVLDTSKVVPTRVKNTLNTIPDGVVIVDAEGRVIVANDAFQKSTGIQAEELIGSGLDGIPFITLDTSLPWRDPEKSVKSKNGVKALLKRPDGDRFFTVGCSPIFDAEEHHAGNLVSFQDITELENQKLKIECTLNELSISKEKLREQNEKLHELASRDMLTGVFNRRYLFEHLEHHWDRAAEQSQALSVIMLDVDHFKKLNDGHGHSVGDQVLRDVAAVIRRSAPERAIVGRYGGEEFCVVLPDLHAPMATVAAESIRVAIETNLQNPYRVTASIGVASNTLGAESFNAMLDRADKALYSAKHAGRNAVHCWSEDSGSSIPGSIAKPEIELSTMVQELVDIAATLEKPAPQTASHPAQ